MKNIPFVLALFFALHSVKADIIDFKDFVPPELPYLGIDIYESTPIEPVYIGSPGWILEPINVDGMIIEFNSGYNEWGYGVYMYPPMFYNGSSLHVMYEAHPLSLSLEDGSLFSLNSFDMVNPSQKRISVTGTYLDGSEIYTEFKSDSTFDLSWKTHYLGEGWSGLSRVAISVMDFYPYSKQDGSSVNYDNIVFNSSSPSSIPEPHSLALIFLGLIGGLFSRTKAKSTQ